MRLVRCTAALAWVAAAAAQAPPLPRFDQFPAPAIFTGKAAAPVLKTARQRQFRTRIREGASKRVNFAGHYIVADWGCGAGCVSIVVIDARDGAVYDGPFQVLAWAPNTYEGKIPSNTPEFVPLDFHKESRLLIARGCPEEEKCGSYFWEWTAPKFKLLQKVDATPIPQ